MNWSILHGDVREQLATLQAGSVQTCVTSPPYWGLRDYGHAGQIGLEPTPDAFVATMVAVFSEVRRVLADDGTLWLNLGDSYANSGERSTGRNDSERETPGGRGGSFRGGERRALAVEWGDSVFSCDGCGLSGPYGPAGTAHGCGGVFRLWFSRPKPKDLVGIPWRVAFALQADGWYLRSDIIWSKPNPMPESVTDRPTKAHEYIFLLSKSARYYYDADAIRDAMSDEQLDKDRRRMELSWKSGAQHRNTSISGRYTQQDAPREPNPLGRNKRSVWHVATQPYPEAHFATYPEKLIEPCILAGSRPGDTVLDPFTGSGTTGVVAIRHGRSFVGVELNRGYIRLAERRIGAVAPLFASEAVAGMSTRDEPPRSGGLFSEETL